MFMVTGSQADRAEKNKITLLKVSDLNKTYVKPESDDENSDDEDDDDEGLDDDPTIEHINVNHQGGVNRIRSMPQNPGIIATMADTGKAHIFDLTANLASMMGKGPRLNGTNTKPAYTFSGHQDEGFAVDWNPLVAGRLATGDCAGKIRLWNPAAQSSGTGAGSWQVDNTAYSGHTASVEDLQWSPTEATVLSSASADRTVRIWDIRDNTKPQITFDAHSEDVNVISWNRSVAYLLASGSDDGSFKVRGFKSPPSHVSSFLLTIRFSISTVGVGSAHDPQGLHPAGALHLPQGGHHLDRVGAARRVRDRAQQRGQPAHRVGPQRRGGRRGGAEHRRRGGPRAG